MARAAHVSTTIPAQDRAVLDGLWRRAGAERHWFAANTRRGHFCYVCGHKKYDTVAHKPRPKTKQPVS